MKCHSCGLVNFRTATVCKRCQTPLVDVPEAPPADSSLWRNSDLLVIGKEVELPQRCMKCNSSDGVTLKVLNLSHVGKYNFVFLLLGFIFYRTYKIPVTLCSRHHLSGQGTTKKVSILLMVMGALAFIYGLSTSSAVPMIGGCVIIVVGIVLLVMGSGSFAIARRDESHIWLKGVDAQYLAALPQWPKEI
jgi:hypothetical protein